MSTGRRGQPPGRHPIAKTVSLTTFICVGGASSCPMQLPSSLTDLDCVCSHIGILQKENVR